MMNRLAPFVLLAATLASSGCMKRVILDVEDGPTPTGALRTTILQTLDVKDFVIWKTAKYVFWECADDGERLTCKKACDVKDDDGDLLLCQKATVVTL